MLWRLLLPHAVFGFVVEAGTVVDAAPMGRWLVGRTLREAGAYARRKGGTLECCAGGKHRASPP